MQSAIIVHIFMCCALFLAGHFVIHSCTLLFYCYFITFLHIRYSTVSLSSSLLSVYSSSITIYTLLIKLRCIAQFLSPILIFKRIVLLFFSAYLYLAYLLSGAFLSYYKLHLIWCISLLLQTTPYLIFFFSNIRSIGSLAGLAINQC